MWTFGVIFSYFFVLMIEIIMFIFCSSVNFVLQLSMQQLEMWANAQRDGCPAEYRWRPLFNAAKFG